MIKKITAWLCLAAAVALVATSSLLADPCGMVPPIYRGEGLPITRIGLQKTYVFYKDGVETFVIRPGFEGKVDEFGMLIPFPSVPAIRKVPDDIFAQIANAIDPPEVVIDLRIRERQMLRGGFGGGGGDRFENALGILAKNEVQVLKQEAVGMYEVAVLAAGSPEALKKWLDENGFQYPDGMDKVTAEYIEQRWCFVAVKTKVAEKSGVDPKPGQRKLDGEMEAGSTFDGFVQAMGFRFKTEELVVPMRLSAFNPGERRNVVYILTDGPRKIRRIPEEYVVRQIAGEQLLKNVSEPLPLRMIGGTERDLQAYHKQNLKEQRDPTPLNGLAKELFAADLMAFRRGQLSLPHEEDEKELLQIGEHFGLRGPAIDAVHAEALALKTEQGTRAALKDLGEMTLTVVDGDFPREVLAKQNLSFVEFTMSARQNKPTNYDAKLFGPGPELPGVLIETGLDWPAQDWRQQPQQVRAGKSRQWLACTSIVASICLLGSLLWLRRRK